MGHSIQSSGSAAPADAAALPLATLLPGCTAAPPAAGAVGTAASETAASPCLLSAADADGLCSAVAAAAPGAALSDSAAALPPFSLRARFFAAFALAFARAASTAVSSCSDIERLESDSTADYDET